MPAAFKGVILDVDGTLVDSNDAHAAAWAAAMHESGRNISTERIHRLIGMGTDKLLQAAAGIEKDSPEGKHLAERQRAIFGERYLADLQPTPEARSLLEWLRARHLRLVVASSSNGDQLHQLLEISGASGLVDDIASADEAGASKPQPASIDLALKKLGVGADEALMLGDTPYDVEAARGAGVEIIAFRSGGWDDAALAGALAIYDDPADLLRHLERDPATARRLGEEP